MREEWVEFDWSPLALHLLHQRHEAVGVESGTVELTTQQHKLAQHHRHGDVGASPFGSWEIPSMERALHSLHVLSLYPAARLNPLAPSIVP